MLLRRQGILERCLKRLEWDKVQSREAKAAADAKEAERLAMQSIDWCACPVPEPTCHEPLTSSGYRASVWRVYCGHQWSFAQLMFLSCSCHSCPEVPSRGAVLWLGRHDFVVVETIDFYEDEEAELPPPMSLRDVQV